MRCRKPTANLWPPKNRSLSVSRSHSASKPRFCDRRYISLISLRNGHQIDELQHALDNVECGKGNIDGPKEVDTHRIP